MTTTALVTGASDPGLAGATGCYFGAKPKPTRLSTREQTPPNQDAAAQLARRLTSAA